MHTAVLAITASLGSLALAQSDPNGILASISALEASLVPPPAIASAIANGNVPAYVDAAATNPASLSRVLQDFATGDPAWFTGLPTPVKSYLLGNAQRVETIAPKIQSLSSEALASGLITSGGDVSIPIVTSGNATLTTPTGLPLFNVTASGNTTTTTMSNSTTRSTTRSGSSSSTNGGSSNGANPTNGGGGGQSNSSNAGAPLNTAAVTLGVAGFLGALGMLMVL